MTDATMSISAKNVNYVSPCRRRTSEFGMAHGIARARSRREGIDVFDVDELEWVGTHRRTRNLYSYRMSTTHFTLDSPSTESDRQVVCLSNSNVYTGVRLSIVASSAPKPSCLCSSADLVCSIRSWRDRYPGGAH